jgi:hypothetical protein
MKPVKNLGELKEMASIQSFEGYILLKFGVRSSKHIEYNPEEDSWYIYNYIDDTEQRVNTKELRKMTNIVEALEKGALFKY